MCNNPSLPTILAFLSFVICGCSPTGFLQRADARPGAVIEQLDWLAGKWEGVNEGVRMQEFWMSPIGGIMPGLHRDVFPRGSSYFEYLRIADTDVGTIYSVSRLGKEPTTFRLIHSSEGKAVFENPNHEFPQRIIYRLDVEGALHIELTGRLYNEYRSYEYIYRRTGE